MDVKFCVQVEFHDDVEFCWNWSFGVKAEFCAEVENWAEVEISVESIIGKF